MTFLAILIILFFYRNWSGTNPVREHVDIERYFSRIESGSMSLKVRYLLAVGVPSILIWIVAGYVSGWLQGLVWLLLSLVVLIYCVELGDLEGEFHEQTLRLQAIGEGDSYADVVQLQEDFQTDHLHAMFQSIVPVMFWFLIVGPGGAILYTLSVQYLERTDDENEVEWLDQVIFWMEWVPVRITGLLFCFAGNFGPTFDCWLNQVADTKESSATHLTMMASLASDTQGEHEDDVVSFARFAESHVREMKYLCDRALFGWLGVAALAVILRG